jgi:hypothetical protein
MKTKDLLLNGIFRCGNTYLALCVAEAIYINEKEHNDFKSEYHLHNHTHNAALLKLNDPDKETIHFVIFRNPEQLIPSLFMFHNSIDHIKTLNDNDIKESILNACSEYNQYLRNQIKYEYATVILFDDIINNIDPILKKILGAVEIEYVNKVDIEKIKENLFKMDNSIYKDSEDFYRNYHLPREEKYPEIKNKVLNIFKELPEFKILMDQYLEIEKRAKELTPLTISN